jgi:hypothetical protein
MRNFTTAAICTLILAAYAVVVTLRFGVFY